MGHKKRVLPEDWYHCTIRDARKDEGYLRITWTVDRGEYVYRNIIEKYLLDDEGINRLKRNMQEINYVVYDDRKDPFFFEQFTNVEFRANLHIDRRAKGSFIENVVLERKLPDKPRDYNIKKPKDDSFYNKNNKGKALPIQEETEDEG